MEKSLVASHGENHASQSLITAVSNTIQPNTLLAVFNVNSGPWGRDKEK